MIYNQKSLNVCFGTAAANLIERKTSKAPRLHDIENFYRAAGFDTKLGVRTVRTFFNKWAGIPLAGVKLKSFRPLWALIGFKYHLAPRVLLKRLKSGYFIFTVRTPIKLDENGYMIPPEDKRGDTHMVVLDHIDGEDLVLENSWGSDWGKSGYFKIRILDVMKCCLDIWSVEI